MVNKSWDEERTRVRTLLKDLRKNRAGMTQLQLSEALGKPQSYVSKYENGERKLDYVEVLNICEQLDLTIGEFHALFENRETV